MRNKRDVGSTNVHHVARIVKARLIKLVAGRVSFA